MDSKLEEYLNELSNKLTNAYIAFGIFQSLRKLKAPNIVGVEKSKENEYLIYDTDYRYFFIQTERSNWYFFMSELAKFFDASEKALSIHKAKKCMLGDMGKINVSLLRRGYKKLTKNDINSIEEEIQEKGEIIERLKYFRDKYLAHNDLRRKKIPISVREVESLFLLVEKIINKISMKVFEREEGFELLVESAENSTKNVVEALLELEKIRDGVRP